MIKINIVQAKNLDKKKILMFLKEHWSENHILIKKNKVFETYYKEGKKLNFFLAKDKQKIVGLLGFVKDEKYSKLPNSIIWTSLLISLNNYPTVGIKLVEKLVKSFKFSDIGCMGNNLVSERLFKLAGFRTIILNHYYLIKNKRKYQLIKFKRKKNLLKKKLSINFNFEEVSKKNIKNFNNFNYSFKNKNFLINKYLLNKFYNYKIYVIYNDDSTPKSFLIYRVINIKNSKCIRIVDRCGDFKTIKNDIAMFSYLLKKYNAEYLDFYSSEKIPISLNKYINKNSYDNNTIIPNYFEPFVQSNIKIRGGVFFNRLKKKYFFFKAEGDSERPNLLQ